MKLLEVCALKGRTTPSYMSENGRNGEPLEFCEECGSPLVGTSCLTCGTNYRDGASPVGAAPLDRRELSRVLSRTVGTRAHGSYVLSMQQAEGMAHLRDQIESMVEQFNASPQTKNSVKQGCERNAVKLLPELGPTKAAIASVAQEFLSLGRSMAEVSYYIARVQPRIGRVGSLVMRVYASEGGADVEVLVNSRRRQFKSFPEGLYQKLRVPVYCWDSGAMVELMNAVLCRRGYPARTVRLQSPSKFVLAIPEKTFQLFKILEEAKLSDASQVAESKVDPVSVARKYSIAKLPFTERFLRETGYLSRVNARYSAILGQKVANGKGRMPRKLAEEALVEACYKEVPALVSELVASKYHLKPSEMSSLLVLPELEGWQRLDSVG